MFKSMLIVDFAASGATKGQTRQVSTNSASSHAITRPRLETSKTEKLFQESLTEPMYQYVSLSAN